MKKYISKQEEEIIPEHLILGKVTGVFGLKGEVRVYLHNRESSLFNKKRLVSLYFSDDRIEQKKCLAEMVPVRRYWAYRRC